MARRDWWIGCAVGVAAASLLNLHGRVRAQEPHPDPDRSLRADHCADFTSLGSFIVSSFTLNGVIVTGSNDVSVLQFNGLGIFGGAHDFIVETNESIRFEFDGFRATNVTYVLGGAGDGDTDGLLGECLVEAYDANALSLGVQPVSYSGPIDVSALFAGKQIRAFEVRPTDGDIIYIANLCYDVAPNLCAGDTDDDGDTDIFDFAVFLTDFGCTS